MVMMEYILLGEQKQSTAGQGSNNGSTYGRIDLGVHV